MKNTTFFQQKIQVLSLLLAAFFGSQNLKAQEPASLTANSTTVVTVYQEANLGGSKRECRVGKYRTADLPGLDNNAASSIKVSAGYEVEIFDNDNYGGGRLVFDGDVKNLADFDFNDKLSSMIVRAKTANIVAKLFRNPNHKGMFTVVKTDNLTLNQSELTNGVGNDALSSVWLDPAYEMIIFQDKDYAGLDFRLDKSDQSFGGLWNDKVSSVMVRKKIVPPNPTTLKFEYKKKVAFWMPGHGYLKYQVRDKGINLGWSETPVFEWEIQGDGNPSGKVQTGKLFRLYNHVEKDYLVFAVRDNGIHLRWLKDSSKKDAFDWTFESENLANSRSAVFLRNRTLASDNKPAYIRYGVRDEGINLIFSSKTSFAPILVEVP